MMRALRLLILLAALPLGGCVIAASAGPAPVYGYYGYHGRPYAYAPPPRWYGPPRPRPYRYYGWGYGRPWYRY
jgi:hypothetical protein